MIHTESYKVTKEHGVRPAGPQDKCFYCGKPIGSEHKENCVMRERTVKLRVTFDIIKAVPESWDKKTIESHYGGKWSYCMTNLADIIGEGSAYGCMCDWHVRTELIDEATEQEEVMWFGEKLELNKG